MRRPSLRKRVWLVTRLLRLVLTTLNLLTVFVRVKVRGPQGLRQRDFLPRKGAVLVVCNHPSTFDPVPLFGSMRRNVAFLAAAELFKVPVLGKLMRWMGNIPVDRGTSAAAAALEFAELVLVDGGVVGMFPEGHTSVNLVKAKTGAARLAFKTGALVVPVGLAGTHRVKPRGKKPRLLLRRVSVTYGVGFYAPRVTSDPTVEEINAFIRQMMDAIADLSGQPRLPDESAQAA